jgi:phospholipid transport system substrate-binding protein
MPANAIKETSMSVFSYSHDISARVRTLLLAFAVLMASALAAPAAMAQDGEPTAAVRLVVDNILAILRKPGFELESDRPSISAEIARAFDATAMAQSVLSTNWRSATPDQQSEFRDLLMQTIENTYIGRIRAYTNESVEFRSEEINENRAEVDTVIVTSSNEVPVNYKLRRRSDGWFVYDVEVENVSMVSSYRDTYRSIVRRSGMDGLIEQMKAKINDLEV